MYLSIEKSKNFKLEKWEKNNTIINTRDYNTLFLNYYYILL